MTEKQLQSQILRAIGGRPDVRLFRNQVGRYKTNDGRWISYGLASGSADLVGIRKITVSPEMVGKTIGQFVSIEVKGPKTPVVIEQIRWRDMVNDFGGLAMITREVPLI